MEIKAVMEEVAGVVRAIGGPDPLRVFGHPVKKFTPPAAIVTYPDTINFDETYGRGSDRFDLGVWVCVGDANAESARDVLSDYTAGAGPRSIKAALESHEWASCDRVTATSAEFDPVTMAGITYMGAMFTLDVMGPGSGS